MCLWLEVEAEVAPCLPFVCSLAVCHLLYLGCPPYQIGRLDKPCSCHLHEEEEEEGAASAAALAQHSCVEAKSEVSVMNVHASMFERKRRREKRKMQSCR